MGEEIESLYALLGVKPDEASVSDSVDKLVKAVQSKLKSSIYGGENGVITLPATLEGKFKNGKEIDQEIKDAYAAIYKKAQQMADESVSLTLNDIKDFKAQIDKFGRKTAKYKGSDIIANANNNLRQMLSDYQDFVNDLRKQVNAQQKTQTKQAQKAKAQQRAKTKKSSYSDISDEEINDAIAKENARQAKIKAWRDKQAEEVASRLGYRSGSIDASRTNKKDAMASEFSEYSSQWARELAKTIKETYSKELTKHIFDKEFKSDQPKGRMSRKTTKEEYLNHLSTKAIMELGGLIGKVEHGSEDVTFDQIVEAIGLIRTIFEENGKSMSVIAQSISTAVQSRYDQPQDTQPDYHGDRKKIYKKDKYGHRVGGIDAEEGTDRGVGVGHAQAQEYQKAIQQLLKKMLGEVEDISEQEVQVNKVAEEMVKETKKSKTKKTKNSSYERVKTDAKTSGASEDTRRLAEELKNGSDKDNKAEINRLNTSVKNVGANVKEGTKATNVQTTYDKMDNVKKDTDEAKHRQVDEVNRDINKDVARSVKADETTGFNTDTKADELISVVKDIGSKMNTASQATKNATSKIQLPSSTKDLYKALPDPNRLLGLPKPDGRRKKISDGMKDENPPLSLVPVQDALKKSLAVIPGEFAKTLKEAVHPSVLDKQKHIDRPEGTDKFEYDEDMLRRLANASNARKEARRKQSMDYTPPPRTIIPDYQPRVKHSDIYASPIKTTLRDVFENFLNDLTGASEEYKKIVNASTEQQDKMAAERVKIWGMNNGRNPNDTGDIASMRRVLELYRNNKASIEQNPELMQKIKLTDPVEIDTTEITKAFNKALSGKNMRNAQMGGSVGKQILGAMRGFTFMPSIEKSRAQADGLNQILGIINKSLNSLLSNIQMHETTLAGMEESGQARFNPDGTLTEDSTSAAKKTLADLEESKYVLEMLKADLLANEAIVKRTSGNYGQMIKQLSFASPILRDCNGILRNMNAGLDKNGKALKFQTRMAEILNYTFQLMSRSVGQWFKRILSMLNPLNIIKNTFKTIAGWTKSAFQDFGSYDTKWQRTMNVIKINFQRAIKPAMEWIAQKLVNIIGFFNIISMKVQEAFGQVPVDLFDQAGANAEKLRRELEEAANVTAGFDELHDIGSDNSGANDLLGDIYKPQLSDEWKSMAEEIGDLFAGLIKGEKTVGEVFGRIFEMLLDLLGKIAKAIWDWFKQTSLGKWITEHWKGLLATLLALFLGWQLLKIAGPTLLKALWGWITGSKIGELFGKLGTKFMDVFTSTQFGSDFVRGIKAMFNSGGMIGTFKAGGASLGAVFAQALVAVIGVAIAGFSISKGFDIVADDESYNLGYEDYGGTKDKDKKSGAGGKALGTLGGAAGGALAGLAIGGPIGAAIGAAIGGIAGLITTSLAPAFEKLEVAARDANNEMQKIEYYEGAVKGAQSQVDIFDEQQQLLKQSLELSTQAVYDQGEKLGISKSRMDELVQATQNGKFTTDMLTGSETGLAGSLTDLAQKQEHTAEVTKKLEEAQKKLLKAQTELSIAQDIEAGNFEIAAARIEVAEAQGVYATEEATAKRIQLYKQGGEEERKNLLQNLTQDQRQRMAEYTATTDKELQELSKIWQESSDDVKKSLLDGVGADTQQKFQEEMNSIDAIVKQHQGFWQKAGDTIAEIFSFGNATTWTYNAQAKYEEEKKKGKFSFQSYDIGTNYVPSDGLAYLHQGEAVIPKKYNQPYQPQNNAGMENAINNLVQQVAQISNQVNQGIPVKGQFVQRGSDLVATVERANNRIKNNVLNNRVYAR
jgi:hypothetical protein